MYYKKAKNAIHNKVQLNINITKIERTPTTIFEDDHLTLCAPLVHILGTKINAELRQLVLQNVKNLPICHNFANDASTCGADSKCIIIRVNPVLTWNEYSINEFANIAQRHFTWHLRAFDSESIHHLRIYGKRVPIHLSVSLQTNCNISQSIISHVYSFIDCIDLH